jgi:hypothetical protein
MSYNAIEAQIMAKNTETMINTIKAIEQQITDMTLDTIQPCPAVVTKLGTIQSLSKAIWTHAQTNLGYQPSGTYEYYQKDWYSLTLMYIEARNGKDWIISNLIPLAGSQQDKQKGREGVYLTQAGRWAKYLIESYIGQTEPDLITSVKIKNYQSKLVNKHDITGGFHIWEHDGKPVMSIEQARQVISDAEPKPTKKGKKKASQ